MTRLFLACALALAPFAAIAGAQPEAEAAKPDAPDPANEAGEAAEADPLTEMGFKQGPIEGQLGSVAHVQVPAEFAFGDGAATRKFLEATGNIPSGAEKGTVISREDNYFIVFDFDPSGYVKDDEKDDLDAEALLKGLREGQENSNKERQKRGLDTLEIMGWHTPPHYDAATHNLEWGTLLKASDGDQAVNYNVRVLGRAGVMSIELVAGPEGFEAALPHLRQTVSAFQYNSGQDYASFQKGDKIAEYGLGALIVGGAAATAAKTGLLSKAWKFLVLLGVAAVGFLKKLFGGRKKPVEPAGS